MPVQPHVAPVDTVQVQNDVLVYICVTRARACASVHVYSGIWHTTFVIFLSCRSCSAVYMWWGIRRGGRGLQRAPQRQDHRTRRRESVGIQGQRGCTRRLCMALLVGHLGVEAYG